MKSRVVSMTTGYRYTAAAWTVSVDQEAATRLQRSGLADLPPTTRTAAEAATTPQDLMTVLEAMEAPTAAVSLVTARVEAWRESRLILAVIDALKDRRPKSVYFGDYDSMPGKILIPDLIAKRDAETLTRGEEAVIALLALASVRLEDFLSPESHEHLVRDAENSSNSISAEVFAYWTQNTNLAVRLQVIGTPEPGAVAPLNLGPAVTAATASASTLANSNRRP